MKEIFRDYILDSRENPLPNGRWSVGVLISRIVLGKEITQIFIDDKISLILKEEAAKEAINLGKNMINRNLIGF